MPAQLDLFVAIVEKEFGTVGARVRSRPTVPEAVADYLAQQNLPRTGHGPASGAADASPGPTRPLLRIRSGRAEATDLVSLQHAFAASPRPAR